MAAREQDVTVLDLLFIIIIYVPNIILSIRILLHLRRAYCATIENRGEIMYDGRMHDCVRLSENSTIAENVEKNTTMNLKNNVMDKSSYSTGRSTA